MVHGPHPPGDTAVQFMDSPDRCGEKHHEAVCSIWFELPEYAPEDPGTREVVRCSTEIVSLSSASEGFAPRRGTLGIGPAPIAGIRSAAHRWLADSTAGPTAAHTTRTARVSGWLGC
jgi:hypothetical protein